jgi:hypothetical protein
VLWDGCTQLACAEARDAFLFASYNLGHLVFLLNFRLDEFYNWARRSTLDTQDVSR